VRKSSYNIMLDAINNYDDGNDDDGDDIDGNLIGKSLSRSFNPVLSRTQSHAAQGNNGIGDATATANAQSLSDDEEIGAWI
jgi:hypothetical protein